MDQLLYIDRLEAGARDPVARGAARRRRRRRSRPPGELAATPALDTPAAHSTDHGGNAIFHISRNSQFPAACCDRGMRADNCVEKDRGASGLITPGFARSLSTLDTPGRRPATRRDARWSSITARGVLARPQSLRPSPPGPGKQPLTEQLPVRHREASGKPAAAASESRPSTSGSARASSADPRPATASPASCVERWSARSAPISRQCVSTKGRRLRR
jgi:hypothetical protein